MRNLISIEDLSVDEINGLLETATDIMEHPERYIDRCRNKKLATLFFEPSTRTRLSFEAAMYELGGNVISVASADSSSAAKGESVSDTVRVVSCYADIIAMRHPKEGAPFVATLKSGVPIINAGDGGHNHPTQTLADIMTVYKEKGRLGGQKIAERKRTEDGQTESDTVLKSVIETVVASELLNSLLGGQGENIEAEKA